MPRQKRIFDTSRNNSGLACPFQPISCEWGYCLPCQIYLDWQKLGEIIHVCTWCGNVIDRKPNPHGRALVSHGICPVCEQEHFPETCELENKVIAEVKGGGGETESGLSTAVIELLIRERSQGKSLRQLGKMVGRSHERIRNILAKYDLPQVTLLTEPKVIARLGYISWWIIRLRKEGIIKPIRPGRSWLYSEDQVGQIPSLIAETRNCQQCGGTRPPESQRFCRECRQNRKKTWYKRQSPEKKAENVKRYLACRKARRELEREKVPQMQSLN